MSTIQANPTRIELVKLKNKIVLAERSHKLLKDKQDELMHSYISIIKNVKELREEVDSLFKDALNSFVKIKEKNSLVKIYELFMIPSSDYKISYKNKNLMSIELAKIDSDIEKSDDRNTYSDLTTPPEVDDVKTKMESFLPKIVRLAEVEQNAFLMSEEIAKTRRRVNVIENIMIPELTSKTKYIEMKLEENERSNTVRIMKSKEIVLEKVNKDRIKRNKDN